jgi:hypothetical protein
VKVIIDGSGPGRGVEIRPPHVLCPVLHVMAFAGMLGMSQTMPRRVSSGKEVARRVPIMAQPANIMLYQIRR